MKNTFLVFSILMLALAVNAASDKLTDASNPSISQDYPINGCSVAAGTVQKTPTDYGEIAIANIVLKNDLPIMPLPQNLCTAFKAYIVVSAEGANKLGLTGDNPSQEFDVEFWFRDVKTGSYTKPFALTSVKMHKMNDASEYRHHGGSQYTWVYGGYTLVFAAPQALYPLGLKKDGSYKVAVVLKKKGDAKPLFCRYWWHGQGGSDSKTSGVFTISDNDLETIYSTYAGVKGTGIVPAEISAAKAAYDALEKIPLTDSAFKDAAEKYVDAYIKALLYEFDHGTGFKHLSDEQRKDDRAVIKHPDFRKALLGSILALGTSSTTTTTSTGAPTLTHKQRLIELLEHYSKVLRVSVEMRKGFIESVKLKDQVNAQEYEGAWNKFKVTFLSGLTRLGDNFAAQHFDQPYEVLDSQFPRQVIFPRDKLYNTLAEQYAQEQERLTAVTYLLNLVRTDAIAPGQLPSTNDLTKLSSNGLDRSTQGLAKIKGSAPAGSMVAKFFEDRRSKQKTHVTERGKEWRVFGSTSREEVSEFGRFIPYSSLIQQDFRQDRKMQALLRAAETGATADLDNYEALTVGRATGIGGSRVGGYLRGDVLADEARAETDSQETIGYWNGVFRDASDQLNLAMGIPLSAAFKTLGGVLSAVFGKTALPRIGAVAAEKFVETLGPVFTNARVAVQAAVPGLEKGGQYVVEKLTEEGGKKFVYLTQAAKTSQPVKIAAEEFEAAIRAGNVGVTLSAEGSQAFAQLAKQTPELVERGSFVARSGGKVAWGQTAKKILNVETISLKTSGPGLIARLTTNAFDSIAQRVSRSGLSPGFKQGLMKWMDAILLAPSRPLGLPSLKGLWGKVSNIRFTNILKRNPSALASELKPGSVTVVESSGQKFVLEGAQAAGAKPGSSLAWDDFVAGAADAADLNILVGQRLTVGPKGLVPGEVWEITSVGADSLPRYKIVSAGPNAGSNAAVRVGREGSLLPSQVKAQDLTLATSTAPVVSGVSSEVSVVFDALVSAEGSIAGLSEAQLALLTGQRVLVTAGPRAGSVLEITGVSRGGSKVGYRQVKSIVSGEVNSQGVGNLGSFSKDGFASEGWVLERASAATGVSSEAATALQAFGSGSYTGSLAQLESLLKGQRLVVTQGSRAGTVYEVTGIPTGGNDIWYRVVKRAGTAPEIGTSGPLSARTVAEEGLQIEGVATGSLVSGVSSEVSSAWVSLIAGTGDVQALGPVLAGQRIVVTTGSRTGSIYRITGVPKGGREIWYEVEVPKGTAPVKGTSGPLSKQTLADEGLQLEGASAAPIVSGVSTEVSSAWASVLAGTGDVNALGAILKGQRLITTKGARTGTIIQITGVPKGGNTIHYEIVEGVVRGEAAPSLKGTSGPLSKEHLASEGFQLEGAGSSAGAAGEPVLLVRPIKDYLGFQAALGGAGTHATAPVAGAAISQFLGPVTSIPASSVSRIAVAYLPTYKWAQIAVLGIIAPETKEIIVPQPLPVGPDLPTFEYSSVEKVTKQADGLCYGLESDSKAAADSKPNLATLDLDASCMSGRGLCWLSNRCRSSIPVLSGSADAQCKSGMVCCTERIA